MQIFKIHDGKLKILHFLLIDHKFKLKLLISKPTASWSSLKVSNFNLNLRNFSKKLPSLFLYVFIFNNLIVIVLFYNKFYNQNYYKNII
jgi:hypothetical protein